MADEGQIIRGIDWKQAFPFTHIFRTFRIAIHPSKLFLGLLLILTIYAGGRALDGIWHMWFPAHCAVADEVAPYDDKQDHFDDARTDMIEATQEAYAQELVELGVVKNQADAEAIARKGDLMNEAKAAAVKDRDAQFAKVKSAYDDAVKSAQDDYNKSNDADRARVRDRAIDQAKRDRDAATDQLNSQCFGRTVQIDEVRGRGIFRSFFSYEISQFSNVVQGVLTNQWLASPEGNGVAGSIYRFFAVGPIWLLRIHPVFAILFGLLFLAAWSLFGGAISRIAAIHVARDERIAIRQAFNFAVGKFLSFASAPIIPLAIVAIVGGVVALSALVIGNIPYIGAIILGAMFVLVLLAGFVMTLVIFGTLGGFNLMYPTVAVEGSDSFDAISRSFSYVYARPWRMLFYTAVAVAYGAICYLFVKLFLTMILILAHHSVGAGLMLHDQQDRPLLQSMWNDPATSSRLTYAPDYTVLNWGAGTGAFLMSVWIYLLIGLMGAFAVSFYFSANTVIYFLMRNELDATELDDVYLEQSDNDFGDIGPAGDAPGNDEAPGTKDSREAKPVLKLETTPGPTVPAPPAEPPQASQP